MAQPSQWRFESFRLDLTDACLWHDDDIIMLPPKPFAVLTHLVTHAGQLVTKQILLEAVWPETSVSDAVLKVCVAQIRKALGDRAQSPRFVATVHRRGYRFVALVTAADDSQRDSRSDVPTATAEVGSAASLIEREGVIAALHERLERVRKGVRQVVFISGEAGIGKTSVVNLFLSQVSQERQLTCVAGQCIEHYGVGEAYLPILEALGRLCRGPNGEHIVALLRQHAPTWLVQMPWLLSAADRKELQHECLGVTRERMLRELTDAFETLTTDGPLVLVMEDLHWSDNATLDLMAFLARRQEPAQLLFIGTHRPAEMMVNDHPLRSVMQTLGQRPNCSEYPLALLSEAGVAAYLRRAVPLQQVPVTIIRALHQRTDGNPLFLAIIVASMQTQSRFQEQDGTWHVQATLEALETQVPDGLRAMIEQLFDRLPAQAQQLLEAASVVGAEFSVAAVAAAIEADLNQVEAQCEILARQQHFLRPAGLETWPDETLAARYGFIHGLYQHVIYQRIGAGQRVLFHQRIAACLESSHGSRVSEIAAELALHFLRGHKAPQAVRFLHQAAQNAMHRQAHREAHRHLTNGLALLQTLPDTPQRGEQELGFLMVQRVVLGTLKGFRAPEMAPVLSRVQALYQQVEDIPPFAMAFCMGLWVWYLRSSHTLKTAKEVAERYLAIAQRRHHEEHILRASQALGTSYLVLGAPTQAREHLERALAMYDPERHSPTVIHTTLDPGVSSFCWMALALWLLGYPKKALMQCREGLNLARQLGHPYSEAFALNHMTRLHRNCGDYGEARQCIGRLMSLCVQEELGELAQTGHFLHAWGLTRQGQTDAGIRHMRQALATAPNSVSSTFLTRSLTTLAMVLGGVGQMEESLKLIDQALAIVAKSSGHYHEAELLRLKGECLLQQPVPDERWAERCFFQALDIARHQEAKALELRIAISQSRLWNQQGKREEALSLLAPVYGWFTEGLDTADLQEAQSLLGELQYP